MTWQALEHERRVFNEYPTVFDMEAQYMSKGWIIKARFPNWDGDHNISWFWIPVGNCTACRFFLPATEARPGCVNPNAAIREKFYDYLNANDCPGFVGGQSANDFDNQTDVMRAAGLADGEPSQPVEILQKLEWTPWRSHQAHAQQEAFLAAARSNDYGQPERGHRQDLGDIEA